MDTQERKEVLDAVRDPTRGDWPAELRDLPSEKMRQFVLHYIASGNGAAACRVAGYLTPDHPAEAFAKCAYKLLLRDDVVAALAALAKRQIRSLAPEAVRAIKETLDTSFHRDRMRAAAMVLDRTDAVTQKVDVTHTHKIDHDAEALNQLRSLMALGVAREKLVEVFGQFGLERLEAKLPQEEARPVLDAEYVEVGRDPDADLFGE